MNKTAIIFKELRKEKGLTQNELAQKLKIGQSSIVGYEKGDRDPVATTLIAYADFFGVSVDYLLGRSDDFGTVVIHSDPSEMLTSDEKRLISAYRKLVPNMKKFMLNNAEMLAAQNG